MFSYVMNSPFRFLLAAGLIAALLCLFPVKVDAPQENKLLHAQQAAPLPMAQATLPPDAKERSEELEAPVHADLSERTAQGCYLHRTMYYAPCAHSVQRREALPARLAGLSRTALESEIGGVIPGAVVTGFSSQEVDISVSLDIPCPLHWVLAPAEDGMLCIRQNRMGEALETVRRTDVPLSQLSESRREELSGGRIFDDVQALEGYLESLSS